MSIKISVVTPSYNQAKFLERTIHSVVSQRDSVHEYFLLDGGSSDGSVDIIKRHSSEIDWWVSERDEGQSYAIHRGFQQATGDVLCWINSDDFFLPGVLSKIQKIFDAKPSIDIVAGYLVFVDSDDKLISLPRVSSGNNFLGRYGLVQVSQQATFFRRELYEHVGGLDLSMHCAMDFDLWSRFYKAGAKWHNIPLHLAAFRQHGGAKGSGNTWWQQYQEEKNIVRKRYPEIFGNPILTKGVLFIYRVNQLFSGRKILSTLDTYKYKGTLAEHAFM